MKNPKLIVKPFAKNGQKNVIPENYETSMESNQATWDQGFGQITMLPVAAGGLPPKGQDFNGIFNQISENIVYLSQGGRFKFSAEYAEAIGGYPKGAILQSDDEKKEYLSLIDNNKINFNVAPDISASWEVIGGSYATKAELTNGLNKKVNTSDVSQVLGNDLVKVPSLDLVTRELGKKASTTDVANKLDKSAVVQETGISATAVMSQKAVGQALDQKASVFDLPLKLDKSSVTQDAGTSSSLVMSQKGVTENDIPVGTVIFVSHNKPVTGRFLKAVGPAVSRTLYADLFAAIGTTYGAGDGSTTFNLPDTRDEFPRFSGDNRAVGSKQGDATRNFTGTVSGRTSTNAARIFSNGTTGVFSASGTDGAMLDNGSATSPSPADRMNTIAIDGGRQLPIADEIRPRNMAFAGWIKY